MDVVTPTYAQMDEDGSIIYSTKPTCYAHEFGREALAALRSAKVQANDAQDQQIQALITFLEAPKGVVALTLQKTQATDRLTRYIIGRVVTAMPAAPADPLTIMAARLLCETEDDAMVVCAMLFAMVNDSPDFLLTLERFAEYTEGYVFDRATLDMLIEEQKTRLIEPGADENRLNSLHNYEVLSDESRH